MRIAPCVASVGLALVLAACGNDPPPAKPAPAMQKPRDRLSYQELKPDQMSLPSKYPLKTCAVSGKDLPPGKEGRYAISWKGYEMQFCSENCIDEFARDPEKYVLMMNPRAMFK